MNAHANYPIKTEVCEILENDEILTDEPTSKFCVSWFVMQVANLRNTLFVWSWNAHPMPGTTCIIYVYIYKATAFTCLWFCMQGEAWDTQGVPNVLMGQDNRVSRISTGLIPNPQLAVQMYTDCWVRLTDPESFGSDPLANNIRGNIKDKSLAARYPSLTRSTSRREASDTCECLTKSPTFRQSVLS